MNKVCTSNSKATALQAGEHLFLDMTTIKAPDDVDVVVAIQFGTLSQINILGSRHLYSTLGKISTWSHWQSMGLGSSTYDTIMQVTIRPLL